MISRKASLLVQTRLAQFDSVGLLGPRQIGKTTLAREIADQNPGGAKYLDLENPAHRRLLDDPSAYFSANARQLIVLDEIHRMPEIFQVLRGQIDERRRMGEGAGKFLILGSASMELMRQSSESLAGRISYVELTAITAREVTTSKQGNETGYSENEVLWLKGGFPPSYLRADNEESLQWRSDFIQTYLERDLPQFGLNVATDRMELFWRMLANDQGELFNAQRFARSLGVSGNTVSRYLDVLHKLLMIRMLQPWYANTGKRLVKSPRPYIRDSGVLHALLNLCSMDDLKSHPVAGKSWEGFVIENLIAATTGKARPYFYRTGAGAEADLILEFAPGKCWAFEVKLSSAPRVERGFHNAADDVGAARRILIYNGKERFPMRGGIEAMSLVDAMNEISVETGAVR